MTETTELAKTNGSSGKIEQALIGGDLSKLSVDERLHYYKSVCESVGLNYLTRPFDYIVLNGKLILYARKDATDQLRNIHGVSVRITAREVVEDCYVVTANAKVGGREDESIGAVNIAGLRGDARANAMMKAETKSKRRVTLSICGLGMLDETELETIQDAHPEWASSEANSLAPQEQLKARQANPQPPRKVYCTQQQQDALRDIADEIGLPNAERVEILRKYGVKRNSYLTPEQCNEAILDLCKRRVGDLLTELGLNLDDVRQEDPSVAADTPDELDQAQANAALTVLRAARDRLHHDPTGASREADGEVGKD